MADNDWRLTLGTLSQSEFDNAGYAWVNMNTAISLINSGAKPSDMLGGLAWYPPLDDSDKFNQFAQTVDTWLSSHGYGGSTFQWMVGPLSPDMIAQLRSDLFSNADDLSAEVTVRTLDSTWSASWVVLNAVMHWPNPSLWDRRGTPYWFIPLIFTEGITAPSGPDLSLIIDGDDTPDLSMDEAYTLDISNDGDAATYSDIVVDWDIETDVELVSAAGTGWAFEYSTNDGSSYSSSPPDPIANTTNLRCTYSGVLNANGGAANQLTITCQITDGGVSQLEFVVSTGGDSVTDQFGVTPA